MSAKKKAKKASGPSGVNQQPGYLLRATPEEFDAWQKSAETAGMPLSHWIRVACNALEERKRRR